MSAPCSIGRTRIGVATVLSTISGNPRAWATCASASMSQTLPAGFPTDSQKIARVVPSINGVMSAARSVGAKRAWIPLRRSVWASSVCVVP